MLNHDGGTNTTAVKRMSASFGAYHVINVYYPAIATVHDLLPVVIFLHPFSYQSGFVPTYDTHDTGAETGAIYGYLAQQGAMVLTFDALGFGIRVPEAPLFYSRYPQVGSMCD